MLTIKTLENIKLGARITYLNGIFTFLFGLCYLGFLKFILKGDLRNIDVVWQVFAKYNPQINLFFIKLMVIKAIFIIAIGIAIIYLSSHILRKKDRAAWIILFIIGLIFWPSLLTIEILNKNMYTLIASLIGWLSFILGMIIPIRYYMQKDYDEY